MRLVPRRQVVDSKHCLRQLWEMMEKNKIRLRGIMIALDSVCLR